MFLFHKEFIDAAAAIALRQDSERDWQGEVRGLEDGPVAAVVLDLAIMRTRDHYSHWISCYSRTRHLSKAGYKYTADKGGVFYV